MPINSTAANKIQETSMKDTKKLTVFSYHKLRIHTSKYLIKWVSGNVQTSLYMLLHEKRKKNFNGFN